MALDTQKRKQVVYFVGDEIENTIAKGFRTLFVVGTRDPKEIMSNTKEILQSTTASFATNIEDDLATPKLMIFPNPV